MNFKKRRQAMVLETEPPPSPMYSTLYSGDVALYKGERAMVVDTNYTHDFFAGKESRETVSVTIQVYGKVQNFPELVSNESGYRYRSNQFSSHFPGMGNNFTFDVPPGTYKLYDGDRLVAWEYGMYFGMPEFVEPEPEEPTHKCAYCGTLYFKNPGKPCDNCGNGTREYLLLDKSVPAYDPGKIVAMGSGFTIREVSV